MDLRGEKSEEQSTEGEDGEYIIYSLWMDRLILENIISQRIIFSFYFIKVGHRRPFSWEHIMYSESSPFMLFLPFL